MDIDIWGEHHQRESTVPGGGSVSGLPGFDELKRSGALQGIRILDFGTAWAGAIPGHVLADFGAEVIKIESQDRVDLLRYGPGPYAPMRGKPWTEARPTVL
jgi:hypothetical protein